MKLSKYNANLSAKGNTPAEVKKKLEEMIKDLEVKETELYGYVWISNICNDVDPEHIDYGLELYNSEERATKEFYEDILDGGRYASPLFKESDCPHVAFTFYKNPKEKVREWCNLLVDRCSETLGENGFDVKKIKRDLNMSLEEQLNY